MHNVSDFLCQFSAILLSLFLIIIFSLLAKIKFYKTQLYKQNVQLIRLYLDQKLIAKILELANGQSEKPDMFDSIAYKVKEYFQLDDMIIYDEKNQRPIRTDNLYIQSLIYKDITHNADDIARKLEHEACVIHNTTINKRFMALYIAPIHQNSSAPFVVFVQHGDARLAKYEIDTLCSTITHLLSCALSVQDMQKT